MGPAPGARNCANPGLKSVARPSRELWMERISEGRTRTAPSPAAAPAQTGGIADPGRALSDGRAGTGLSLQRAPVLQHIGPPAVNLQPRQRFLQHMTMEQRAL